MNSTKCPMCGSTKFHEKDHKTWIGYHCQSCGYGGSKNKKQFKINESRPRVFSKRGQTPGQLSKKIAKAESYRCKCYYRWGKFETDHITVTSPTGVRKTVNMHINFGWTIEQREEYAEDWATMSRIYNRAIEEDSKKRKWCHENSVGKSFDTPEWREFIKNKKEMWGDVSMNQVYIEITHEEMKVVKKFADMNRSNMS